MRIVHINVTAAFSTGRIAVELCRQAMREGHRALLCYARGSCPSDVPGYRIGSTAQTVGYTLLSRLTDRQGFFGRRETEKLVAQLKNQDPTNPMENNELTSQLAQISTVSGIEKLNTTLGSISGQIDNSQSLQASNLIGHGVMIPGTTVLAGTGSEEGAVTTTTPFGVELQQAADKVTATITDKNGAVVRTIDIGELTAGSLA